MNKILKILIGLIVLLGTLYAVFPGMQFASWGTAALNLIKGTVTIILVITGLALIIMGISQLKN